jgi:hypothetical protein
MAWRLEPSTDLIVNLHLQPSGKAEPIQPSIGLYFTDTAPTRTPMLLQLEHDGALDIPPGDAAFEVTDSLELPVDVQVLGVLSARALSRQDIRGHGPAPGWDVALADSHSELGSELAGRVSAVRTAVAPQGHRASRCAGCTTTRAATSRNPSTPPVRVRGGNRASDEMAHFWVQVLPARSEDRLAVAGGAHARASPQIPGRLRGAGQPRILLADRRASRGSDFGPAAGGGCQTRRSGRTEQPGHGAAGRGRPDEAIAEFERRARSRPDYADAEYNLATTLLARGRTAEAIGHLERIVPRAPRGRRGPERSWSRLRDGRAQARSPAVLERSVRLQPANAQAHFNLGLLAAARGQAADAIRHFEEALRLDPDNKETAAALAEVRAAIAQPRR